MCKEEESNSDSLFNHKMPMASEEFDDSLFAQVCDSHCHPHDDIARLSEIPKLKTGHITIMGVRQDDWDTVSKVTDECNDNNDNKKCIPCFGNYKNKCVHVVFLYLYLRHSPLVFSFHKDE